MLSCNARRRCPLTCGVPESSASIVKNWKRLAGLFQFLTLSLFHQHLELRSSCFTLDFFRPFLAMAMLKRTWHCSSGLSKTFGIADASIALHSLNQHPELRSSCFTFGIADASIALHSLNQHLSCGAVAHSDDVDALLHFRLTATKNIYILFLPPAIDIVQG